MIMVVKDPHLRGGYESPVSRTDDFVTGFLTNRQPGLLQKRQCE